MNKFFACFGLLLFFSFGLNAQTKSVAEAQAEIAAFAHPESFSVAYDSSKYVTGAEVGFDILEPKTPLGKQFKKFEFRITTLFAVDGIEEKPVRATLCLNTQSKKFHFSADRSLTVLLDGETINLGEADRATEVKGGRAKENLCWEIDLELIRDFGKATAYEYRIGSIKGTLNAAHLRFFKDYARLLEVKTP